MSPNTVDEFRQLQETQLFLEHAQQLELPVDPDHLARIYEFYLLLLERNKVMNLTRITGVEGFLRRHVLESLLYSRFIPSGAQVLDIGSGGGFPLIPLAIYRPDLKLHSLESVKKKASYLRETAETLELNHIRIYAERAEILAHAPQHRGNYDVVTSRAVAALPVLCEYSLPFLKAGGTMLALKGPKWEDEMRAAENAIDTLGGEFQDVYMPEGIEGLEATGFMVQIYKERRTPKAYPRQAGLPAKQPLL